MYSQNGGHCNEFELSKTRKGTDERGCYRLERVYNVAMHICIERGRLAEGLYLAQELKDRWDEIFDSAMRKIPREKKDNKQEE
jgi:hypothetical protein